MWTFETFEKYFQRQIDDLKEQLDERSNAQTIAMSAALAAAKEAVTKAEIATNKRFDTTNEFRQTLIDQAATFMSKVEVNAKLEALSDRAELNRSKINDLELKINSSLEGSRAAKEVTQQTQTQKNITTNQLLTILGTVLIAVGIGVTIILAVV